MDGYRYFMLMALNTEDIQVDLRIYKYTWCPRMISHVFHENI